MLLAGGDAAAAANALGAALSAAGAILAPARPPAARPGASRAGRSPARRPRSWAGFPFEPVGPGDLPETLVGRLPRTQALRRDGPRRAASAPCAVWTRPSGSGAAALASAPEGDVFAAVVADLGRPPVAGLVEPALEFGLTLADRAEALATLGRLDEAQAAAREAAALADDVRFEGYRDRLVTDARVL